MAADVTFIRFHERNSRTVDDKLNDPTNKCTFDLRHKLNALQKYRMTNISASSSRNDKNKYTKQANR